MLKRAYTLIEMLAVTVVIVALASIVVGRLSNDRNGNTFQRGIQSIESAANKAKNQSIKTGKTYELTFDSSAQSIKVAPSEDNTSTQPTATNSKINRTPTNNSDNQDDPKPAQLGNGWSLQTVHQSDGTDTNDLLIKFYADGTADEKSAEFKYSDAVVSLRVSRDGTIEVKRGELPLDDKKTEWEAGNLEQRTTG